MDIRQKAIDALIEMGANPQNKGFRFTVDAMEMIEKDSSILSSMINGLYAGIAEKNETTASKVERAIRHMSEGITTHGKLSSVEKYVGIKNKMPNSKFLSTMYYNLSKSETAKDISVKVVEVDADTCIFCGSKLPIINVSGKHVCEKCAKLVASQLLAF